MSLKQHGRQYDIVVFGATGYSGVYVAEHITAHLPTDLRWAVAGRSESKLQSLVEECREISPDRVQPDIEICTLDDRDLDSLAKKAFVLITTVGPYAKYGEAAFKACAENGTHYLDITGEVPFVARMISKYEDQAKATGAMMFPQAAIESAPPDLMTWSMAQVLRERLSAKAGDVTVVVQRLDAVPSGGTLATVLSLFDSCTTQEVRKSMMPYALSPIPNPKREPSEPILAKLLGVRTVPELGTVTTFMAGSSDKAIVQRSWGLLASLPSREKQSYGPNFKYDEFLKARNWFQGIVIHLALLVGAVIVATPLRRLARKFVYQPGQGPDKEEASKEVIEYRGTAFPDTANAEAKPESDQFVVARCGFQGGMYNLSAVLVVQAALTLLKEDLGLPGGVFTPSCLGQGFINRLGGAGFKLETKVLKK